MTGAPFHETRIGRTVLEKDLPLIIEYLRQIAHELHVMNQSHKAREGGPDEPPQQR